MELITNFDFAELKNHPFFNGIDWAKVAERTCDPPFAPNEMQIDEEASLDWDLLQLDVDNELEAAVADRLEGNLYGNAK